MLEILEFALLHRTLEQRMELVHGECRVEFVGWLHPQQPGDAVADRRERPHDRFEQGDVRPVRTSQQAGGTLRCSDRNVLGQHLADDHVHHDDERQGDRERDGVKHTRRQLDEPLNQVLKQMCDRWLSNETQPE